MAADRENACRLGCSVQTRGEKPGKEAQESVQSHNSVDILGAMCYRRDMEERPSSHEARREALRRGGFLHPHPERVQDPAFGGRSPFFEPYDLLQVKYEMLRLHHVEKVAASSAARRFGLSRQSFYLAAAAFWREGIPGLFPQRRGPKGPHKLTPEVAEFLWLRQREHPDEGAEDLAAAVAETFGLSLHPRTVRRFLDKKS